MSGAQIAAYGRLGGAPVQRLSKAGKTWVTATLAVQLAESDEDHPPQWFALVAFGRTAETLARHAQGDLLSVSGRLQQSRWTGRDGEAREQLQIIADSVVSARSVRPGNGRRKEEGDDYARP